MPDEIWVGDVDAERIASAIFKNTPVLLQPNPYFEDILIEIANVKINNPRVDFTKVLYVCEPVAVHSYNQYGNSNQLGYTEQSALTFFLENISVIDKYIDLITIRPHPSEEADKYYWASRLISLPIKFGGQKTLLEEIIDSDIIVGCESMAMVVGLLAGKRVISSIPFGGRPCQLPQNEVEPMQSLVKHSGFHV